MGGVHTHAQVYACLCRVRNRDGGQKPGGRHASANGSYFWGVKLEGRFHFLFAYHLN